MKLNKILALCCTYGRHSCLERSIRMFLDQDYEGEHIMLIFDSGKVEQTLDLPDLPSNKQIVYIHAGTFKSVGEKYNAAIKYWYPYHPTIVTSWNDDDIFLPNHLSEGNKGFEKASSLGKRAYKPYNSYFRDSKAITLVHNVLEPSIFVDESLIREIGYDNVNVQYHQKWLNPLTKQNLILVDPDGVPTLVYNWGDTTPVHKMSGTVDIGYGSYVSHIINSRDEGDGILTPIESAQSFYDEIEK